MTTATPAADRRLDRAYQILSGEDSTERACAAIPDSACTHLPRNYVLNVANGACTKLAEQLASPGLVLPWLLGAMGAPAVFAGFLVPVKQAGSLLPQMAVAARIRGVALRKGVWVAAGFSQAVLLALMIPAALFLPPAWAGAAVVALLALFSMASGAGSVAFQDVVGKTIDKGLRGRMLSNRAAIGGALTLVAALGIQAWLGGSDAPVLDVAGGAADRADGAGDLPMYLLLIAVAAVLWAAGAVLFGAIREEPGSTEGGRDMLGELGAAWALLRRQGGFRAYMGVRLLLAAVELAPPFFALHALELFGGGVGALGILVMAVGVANLVSSHFWGRLADLSSRRTMIAAGAIGAAAAGFAVAVAAMPEDWRSPWLYAGAFLLIGIAEAGVRLGRKTYLVDAAPKDERPLYVALSNTLVGLAMLGAGTLGVLAQAAGAQTVVIALGLVALAAMAVAAAMPEAEAMTG